MKLGSFLLGGLFFILLLFACSRNDDSGPTVTGVLFDSAVQGVDYVCSGGRQGTTNAAGEFTCGEGDRVAFSLGNVDLGAAPAAARVTVFDLAGAVQPDSRQLQEYIGNPLGDGSWVDNVIANGDVPLHRTLNLALFLQTLDADRDPENGIEITADTRVHLKAATYRLNFAQSQIVFTNRLRKVLTQAGIPRSPCQALAVVRHLVNSGVIPGPFQRPVNYDIQLSQGDTLSLSFGYDSSGNLNRVEEDNYIDGSIDYFNEYNFNAQGNLTFHRRYNDQGSVDDLDSYTYDDGGNLTRYELDHTLDGTIGALGVYTCDVNGNQIRTERDYDGDGKNDRVEVATFDANGNRLWLETDWDGDGTADMRESYSYDAQGNQTEILTDFDADGVVDMAESISYNTDGNPMSEGVDTDMDGTVDWTDTWVYDADGKVTGILIDANGDGTIDATESYAYDSAGRLIHFESVPAGGSVTLSLTNAYDPDGGMIRRSEWDADLDGTIDTVVVKTYDAQGNLLESEDSRTDSPMTTTITASYEPADTFSFPQREYLLHSKQWPYVP